METITIPVDSDIKTAFEQASPETLEKLTTLLNLLFKDELQEKNLTEIITENSDKSEDDWGLAERNAYARMNETSHQNIPADTFLEWVSKLEQGKDV